MNGGGMQFAQAQRQQFSLQMQQALRLLQLSNLELAAEISAEVTANPLLDALHPPAAAMESLAQGGSGAATQPYDYARPSTSSAAVLAGGEPEPANRAETLVDHLLAQLPFTQLDRGETFLAQALIGEIDADGYLRANLGEIAGRLGAELADLERVLKVLQGLEPTGVFARDLAECLALQLAERDRLDPLMQALLTKLDLVAQGDRAKLRAALGCEREDLDDMLAELRSLTPRPGLAFGFEPPAVIIPEVRVSRAPDGGWTVESWAPHLPRLVVRQGRFERLASQCRRQEDARYLKERLSAARRFTDLIARRGSTILEVAAEIVKRQEGFLTEGLAGLKPLMMKTVADALGMHESTVSRAVTNKAMLTPRGVVPFKAFFAAAAATLDGSDATQSQVIARIGALIAGEAKTGAVLSDEAISEQLAAEGVKIARRTVAKHREGLGLPIATRRRAVMDLAS